jgi:hypothetical protein
MAWLALILHPSGGVLPSTLFLMHMAGRKMRFHLPQDNLDLVSKLVTTVTNADIESYLAGMQNHARSGPIIGNFTRTDLLVHTFRYYPFITHSRPFSAMYLTPANVDQIANLRFCFPLRGLFSVCADSPDQRNRWLNDSALGDHIGKPRTIFQVLEQGPPTFGLE